MATDSNAQEKSKQDGAERLPFEPSKGRKKKEAAQAKQPKKQEPRRVTADEKAEKRERNRNLTLEETRIPDVVGKRMLRRMAIFSGVPAFLGVATFFVAFYIISNGILEFPNAFVVAVSMLFFGLSVVGLSYGVLSASWEEDMEGSLVGMSEFSLNFGRMRGAWREAREAKKAGKG